MKFHWCIAFTRDNANSLSVCLSVCMSVITFILSLLFSAQLLNSSYCHFLIYSIYMNIGIIRISKYALTTVLFVDHYK